MRKIKYILAIIFCAFVYSLNGQTLKYKVKIDNAVFSNGTWHTMHVAKGNLSFSVEDSDLIISVTSFTLKYTKDGSDNTENLTYTLDNGKITDITPYSFDYGVGFYSFEIKLSYVVSVQDENGETKQEDRVYLVTPESLHVWDKVTVGDAEKKKYVLFNEDSIILPEIEVSGGNNEGWVYEWSDGTVGSIREYKAENATNDKIIKNLFLTIRNYAPDNKTMWAESTIEYVMDIYPSPNVLFSSTYPQNVLVEDEIQMSVTVSGGDPNSWSFEWIVGGEVVKIGKDFEYKADKRNSEVKVNIENSPNGVEEKFRTSLTYKFNVFDTPKVKLCPRDTNVCSEQNMSLSVITQGGQVDGWTYEWIFNNKTVCTSKTYSLKAPINQSSDINVYNYTLKVRNLTEGEERFNESYDFNINVWPQAVAEMDKTSYLTNMISEDSGVSMSIKSYGGDPEKWSYEWKENDKIKSRESTYTFKPLHSGDKNFATEYSYVIVAQNIPNASECSYKYEYKHVFKVWAVPKVLSSPENSFVTSGQNVSLSLETEGGQTDGWTYEWKLEGEIVCTTKKYEFEAPINEGTKIVDYNYILCVKNITEGVERFNNVYQFTLSVCPKISVPTKINEEVDYIREGNMIHLSIEPAIGGYMENGIFNWNYEWTNNEDVIGSATYIDQIAEMNAKGQMKEKENKNYKVTFINRGPNGDIWYNGTLSQDIVVYRRPQTPISLQKKGNGTSCTVIVKSQIKDVDLEKYEYEFVYGYTDVEGVNYKCSTVKERFYQYDSSIYNNLNNRLWVIAQWIYDDAIITSGKCYLDGTIDEDYDGSEYNINSRETSNIDEIDVENGYVKIEGKHFRAELLKESLAIVNLYNMNGVLVKTIAYPSSMSFDEEIDMDGISSGIYFIEVLVGGNKLLNKIVL